LTASDDVNFCSGLLTAIQRVRSEGLPEQYYFDQKKLLNKLYPKSNFEVQLRKPARRKPIKPAKKMKKKRVRRQRE